jgi:HSP20 family protein
MLIASVPTLLDRWLEDVDRGLAPGRPFRPALDVIERADGFEVQADVPGFGSAEVEVEFADGVLHLRGERRPETAAEGSRTHLRERGFGRFQRSVALGDDVAVDEIEASVRDGVLRVRVPKSPRSRPRQIPISSH